MHDNNDKFLQFLRAKAATAFSAS